MSLANNCTFIGNLCADPEIKMLDGAEKSIAVLEGSLAINRKFKNKQGQTVEETDFIPFAFYGKGAQVMAKYSRKGHQIALGGEMRMERWTDRESGNNRTMLKLRVENFTFLNNSRD